jgi:hypothetical protein
MIVGETLIERHADRSSEQRAGYAEQDGCGGKRAVKDRLRRVGGSAGWSDEK